MQQNGPLVRRDVNVISISKSQQQAQNSVSMNVLVSSTKLAKMNGDWERL